MSLLLNEHHFIKDWIEFEMEGKFSNETKSGGKSCNNLNIKYNISKAPTN